MGDLDPLGKSGIAMALQVPPFVFERCGRCKRYGTLYSCIGGVGGDHASWVIRCLALGFWVRWVRIRYHCNAQCYRSMNAKDILLPRAVNGSVMILS